MKILKPLHLQKRDLHYFVITIIFSLLTIPAFTQHNVKVELSEQYEEPRNSTVFDVVGYDDGGFVFGRYTRKGF